MKNVFLTNYQILTNEREETPLIIYLLNIIKTM